MFLPLCSLRFSGDGAGRAGGTGSCAAGGKWFWAGAGEGRENGDSGVIDPSRIARVGEQTVATQSVIPGEGCVILRDPKSDCLTFLEPGLTSASRPPANEQKARKC